MLLIVVVVVVIVLSSNTNNNNNNKNYYNYGGLLWHSSCWRWNKNKLLTKTNNSHIPKNEPTTLRKMRKFNQVSGVITTGVASTKTLATGINNKNYKKERTTTNRKTVIWSICWKHFS